MSSAEQIPTLVCLIGPPAVGKMTVGQELCRLTGFKLFHGHVVADVLTPYFLFGTPAFARLARTWRLMFFEEALKTGLNLVMTVAWRFDVSADAETIRTWLQPYIEGGRVLCVELLAPLEVRLERARTENRRRHKNAPWVTETYLREIHTAHRYDSGGTLPFDLPYLQLETEHLSADLAAQLVAEHFDLPRLEDLNSKL
jgi:hypothetical protein